jgi:hypothetical protein
MVFHSIASSSLSALSLEHIQELISLCLKSARRTKDPELALELCGDAEAVLSGIKGSLRRALVPPRKDEDRILSEGIAAAFINLGTLQDSLGHGDKAQVNFKKAMQWG